VTHRGGALKHVEPRHERTTVFHEDGVHPSVEAGLLVTDASKPSDELGMVLVVIESVLVLSVSHTAAPVIVLCSVPLWHRRTPYVSMNRLPVGYQDLPWDPLQPQGRV
jgi:hypothetical protein